MGKNKKISFQELLYNPNFLLVFSALIAVFIWIAFTLNESPEVERVIKDVKIDVDTSIPEQLGYELFGTEEFNVDITVKGKRYLVGDNVLTADDISVTAITSYINSAGSYSLQLIASTVDPNAEYKIVNKSKDYIEVYLDIPKTIEMNVTSNIKIADKIVSSDEYIADTAILSSDKVTITGPTTEVNKIAKVEARINVEEPLSSTQTFPAEIHITDKKGNEVRLLEVEPSVDDMTITIPVYKKTRLPVSVVFANSPTSYIKSPLKIVASPAFLNVAVPEEMIGELKSISVGTINFNDIAAGKNTFEFNTADIPSSMVLDEIDKVKITIDTGNMTSIHGTLSSSNITIANAPSGVTVVGESFDNIVIIGPKEELEKLSSGDITAEINLDGKTLSGGSQKVDAQIIIKNGKCWAYGTYKIPINISTV
ncbi:MAG: hypothetical protein LBH71_03085 [Oscillospiraceae bacterium]|jgi:YbbR domain-containing protein|nr:hypothetical protein [Oscillospiraceae bacterium]